MGRPLPGRSLPRRPLPVSRGTVTRRALGIAGRATGRAHWRAAGGAAHRGRAGVAHGGPTVGGAVPGGRHAARGVAVGMVSAHSRGPAAAVVAEVAPSSVRRGSAPAVEKEGEEWGRIQCLRGSFVLRSKTRRKLFH